MPINYNCIYITIYSYQYNCCGVTWFTDWNTPDAKGAIFKDKDGHTGAYTVPSSCCIDLDTTAYKACMKGTIADNTTAGQHIGCWTKFNDMLDDNQDEILYTGIAIIVIMVGFKNCFVNLIHP